MPWTVQARPRPLIAGLLAILVALFAAGSPAASAQAGTVGVTIGGAVGPINPRVYGANYGPWATVSADMLQPAWDSGVTFIRFPAGRWGDQNDLESYHLALLFALTDKGKMETSISVRLEGGTPEKAAALVRTLNIEQKRGIVYWSIGNEPDIYDSPDVTANSKQWRSIALAMRAVDPTIKLMGPEVSQFPWNTTPNAYLKARYDWVREFLKMNGDLVDVVTVHRYPFPVQNDDPPTTIAQLRANLTQWDTFIPTLRGIIRETLGRDLPVGLTEVNSNWTNGGGGEASPDSFYNAIWWGGVLSKLINQQVDIVNYFVFFTPDEVGHLGMITRYKIRSTYYVYQLFKRFGTVLLKSESANPEVVTVAAKNAAGQTTVLIVNTADDPHTVGLDPAPGAPTETWRLDATHNATQVLDAPAADGSLTVPARSISLYLFATKH
jgi:hypothetical protein